MTPFQFTAELAVGIVSSVVATSVVAAAITVYRTGLLFEWYDALASAVLPQREPASKPSMPLQILRRKLLTRLRRDQSRSGSHFGQFGRFTSLDDEEAFNTGREKMEIKPRVYLTLWPVTILSNNFILQRSVKRATKGMRRLFRDQRIHVQQSAGFPMPPTEQPTLISYRHTMGATLVLFDAEGPTSLTTDILGAMIDTGGEWQNADGGWKQCDRELTESDIWASAYAARLLASALNHVSLSDEERAACDFALGRTLEYFSREWSEKNWAYGRSLAEENAVLILIELAPTLRAHDPNLLVAATERLRSWVTPFGQLSDQYTRVFQGSDRLNHRSLLTLYARMCYAFWRADASSGRWQALFYQATRRLRDRASSADVAFLLDIACRLLARPTA